MDDKIIIYQTADGETSIDVKLDRDTVWLSANQMSELFGRDAKTIRKHINNVFSEGELAVECNTQKNACSTFRQASTFLLIGCDNICWI